MAILPRVTPQRKEGRKGRSKFFALFVPLRCSCLNLSAQAFFVRFKFILLATALAVVLGCGDSVDRTSDAKTTPAEKTTTATKSDGQELAKSPDSPILPPKKAETKTPAGKLPTSLAERIDAALRSATKLLADKQSADGA